MQNELIVEGPLGTANRAAREMGATHFYDFCVSDPLRYDHNRGFYKQQVQFSRTYFSSDQVVQPDGVAGPCYQEVLSYNFYTHYLTHFPRLHAKEFADKAGGLVAL